MSRPDKPASYIARIARKLRTTYHRATTRPRGPRAVPDNFPRRYDRQGYLLHSQRGANGTVKGRDRGTSVICPDGDNGADGFYDMPPAGGGGEGSPHENVQAILSHTRPWAEYYSIGQGAMSLLNEGKSITIVSEILSLNPPNRKSKT